MPECPEVCGGPNARLELLTPSQREVRSINGCDRDIAKKERARYAIKCPWCNGRRVMSDGAECTKCEREGVFAGYRVMTRCPANYQSSDISRAFHALMFMSRDGGAMPEPGGMLDQSPTFLQFVAVFDSESAMIREEQRRRRSSGGS